MKVTVTDWGDPASSRLCIQQYINPDKKRQDEILATCPFVWVSPTNNRARNFRDCVNAAGGKATVEGE